MLWTLLVLNLVLLIKYISMKKQTGKYIIIHRSSLIEKHEIECNEVTIDEIKGCLDRYDPDACGTMSFELMYNGSISITKHNNYCFPIKS